MYMESEDRRKYPDMALWLQNDLPQLPSKKPKVWKAFVKYAGGSWHPWLNTMTWPYSQPWVVTWGMGPKLGVRSWECKATGETVKKGNSFFKKYDQPRLGFTAPDGSLILIASDLAQGTYDPQIAPVLEATVLHELVHWCRLQIGKDVFDEEPPYAFEQEAYGKIMERTWEVCYSPEVYFVKK